ncbi:ER lumen protein-retaining receptor [Glycine max]|nr:ER lumen protein-retaining receptor [Glycine max]
MGSKMGNSPVNISFEKLRKLSMKVKIFLGVLFALCALLSLKLVVKRHYYFFIASEVAHAAGTIALVYKPFSLKTCAGLSLITQEITALFLAARICCSNFALKSSYIKELDNMRLYFVVVPSAILAILIHPYTTHRSFTRIVFAFSMYLEAGFCSPSTSFFAECKGYYVIALGVSRFLAVAHWIILVSFMQGQLLRKMPV